MRQPVTGGTAAPPSGPGHGHRRTTRAILAVPMTLLMPFVLLAQALRGIWDDRASRGVLVTALWLLLAGTIIFMLVEGFSLVDSFYFCFITLATIGYGDLTPTTDLGKILTVVYSVAGLGIIAALIATIAAQRTGARRPAEDATAGDDRRRGGTHRLGAEPEAKPSGRRAEDR